VRVLVVAEQLRRPVSGIGTYIRGLLAGLAGAAGGPEITLWASRPPRGGADPLAAFGVAVATSALPGPAMTRAWDCGLGGPPGHPDVVHATSLAIPPSRRAPVSVMVHDLAWRHFPDAYPARGRRWHEAALGRAVAGTGPLLVPSATVADDLLAAGATAARVEVVEEGCDHLAPADDAGAADLLARLGVDGDFLLTVSTLEPRKNLPRLLAAYESVRDRLPPFLVVGPTGWGPALRPDAGVVLAGPVSGGTLTALYRRARVMAYVPLREGFGLPVVEAMWCGTPVVASAVPSAGGAALEVDPFDVDAIAGALVAVATDDRRRADLIAAGCARAAGLTWAAAARRHVELWQAIK
jgi:glycosyltransferase involved in cell wall biosynthesis